MKILLCFLSVVLAVYCLPTLEDVETEWVKFQKTHARTYRSPIETRVRKAIFTQAYNKIVAHNELYAKGEKTFFLTINKFADQTVEERKKLKGYKKSAKNPEDITVDEFFAPDCADIPDSFDWRTKGAVTPVKNQGQCGACWAFSAVGAIEAQYFFKTGNLVRLSEQNLNDCSHESGNSGCDGGDMNPAFVYVFTNDGLDSEESYPYEEQDGSCRYDENSNVTSLAGYVVISSGFESDLQAAIALNGPLAVAIDASHDDFDYYGGGVYYNEKCSTEDLDHAVLAVGYGTEDGTDYWLVKNSWSEDWGEDGYIKMARNQDNNCGIATEASYPTMYAA